MWAARHWWSYHESSINWIPSPSLYALRGTFCFWVVIMDTFWIISWGCLMNRFIAVLHFREHLLLLEISQFQFFFHLFSYFKALGFCFLHQGWLRKLFFYYIMELGQEDILHILLELMIALGSCTMVPGNDFYFPPVGNFRRARWLT